MGIFDRLIEKKVIKKVAQNLNITEEQSQKLYNLKNNYDKIELYNFLIDRFAKKMNIPTDLYVNYINKKYEVLSLSELNKAETANKLGLSLSNYYEFEQFKEDNAGNNDITEENAIDYYRAYKLNVPVEVYYAFQKRDDKNQSIEHFKDLYCANKLNLSLEDYYELQEAKKLGYTIKEFRNYKIAKSKSMTLNQYIFSLTLDRTKANTVVISNIDEYKVCVKRKIPRIILNSGFPLEKIDSKLFKEIIFSNDITVIPNTLLESLNQETLIIPSSIIVVNESMLQAINKSGVKKVYILSKKILINNNLAMYGNLINHDKIYYFNEQAMKLKTNILQDNKDNIFLLEYNKSLENIGAFYIPVEKRMCVLNSATIDDLSLFNIYEINNLEILYDVYFYNKDALQQLKTVKHINVYENRCLENVKLPQNLDITLISDEGSLVMIDGKQKTLLNALIIKEGTKIIKDYEFSGTPYNSVLIPSSIESIGSKAFWKSDIKEVYFLGTPKYQEDSFKNCELTFIYQKIPFINSNIGCIGKNVHEINLEGLKIIKSGAFLNFDLNVVNIPTSIEIIESEAFSFSPDRNTVINIYHDFKLKKDSFNKYINTINFYNVSDQTILTLISSSNHNIKCVSAPNSISVETYKKIIERCTKLEKICINDSTAPTFDHCGVLDVKFGKNITVLELPSSVLNMTSNCFKSIPQKINSLKLSTSIINCDIESLNLKNKLTLIASQEVVETIKKSTSYKPKKYEFYAMSVETIKEFEIKKEEDFSLMTPDERSRIEKIIIGENIENIPDKAFACMESLKKVFIKGLLKSIGDNAFAYCSSLEKITLSPTVRKIGVGAFYENIKLKEINGFDSLETVEKNAFYGCKQLKKLVFSSAINKIDDCIKECNNLELLVVPVSCELFNVNVDSFKTIFYLPRNINECNIITNGLIYVHSIRGCSWKKNYPNVRYTVHTIEEYKKIISDLIAPYGFSINEEINDYSKPRESMRYLNTSFEYDEDNYESNSAKRASFSIFKKEEKIDDFTEKETSIEEIIESGRQTNEEAVIKPVERNKTTGSYDVIDNNCLIKSSMNNVITNNVFTFTFFIDNYKEKSLFISLIDKFGNSVSDCFKVDCTFIKKTINCLVTLLPNTKNGVYYLVISKSNCLENNIIFKQEVEVKIAFQMMDDFDL